MILNIGNSSNTLKAPTLNSSYPEDISCTIGESASFSVIIEESGYPNVYSYQWYINDSIYTSETNTGETSSTFTYTPASPGTYSIYCIVSNEAGAVKSRVSTLTVSPEYIVSDGQFVGGGYWNKYLKADEHSSINISGGTVHMHVNSYGTARVWTSCQYDFTGKNILKFNCTFDTASGASGTMGVINFGVCDTQNDDNFIAQTAVAGHDGSGETVSVDVSNISGLHYLKIIMIRATDHADVIYSGDIWFG